MAAQQENKEPEGRNVKDKEARQKLANELEVHKKAVQARNEDSDKTRDNLREVKRRGKELESGNKVLKEEKARLANELMAQKRALAFAKEETNGLTQKVTRLQEEGGIQGR